MQSFIIRQFRNNPLRIYKADDTKLTKSEIVTIEQSLDILDKKLEGVKSKLAKVELAEYVNWLQTKPITQEMRELFYSSLKLEYMIYGIPIEEFSRVFTHEHLNNNKLSVTHNFGTLYGEGLYNEDNSLHVFITDRSHNVINVDEYITVVNKDTVSINMQPFIQSGQFNSESRWIYRISSLENFTLVFSTALIIDKKFFAHLLNIIPQVYTYEIYDFDITP